MKIVIIEDEKLTAEHLADIIQLVNPEMEIVAYLRSIKQAVDYFMQNSAPDLIFSDIQLGDGLSFEIYEATDIQVPVIFCTAYDEYALNAFQVNGIDYILKPFNRDSIAKALQKYQFLKQSFSNKQISYEGILELFSRQIVPKASSILVHYKDKIVPVKMDGIALFYIEHEEPRLLTLNQETYPIGKNLEELEKLTGSGFFRVNRQFLVNRKAIKDAAHFFSRKLILNLNIPFDQQITVSKEKTPSFLDWLSRSH
nr:LytTR family DNA-binding domain-containing protein [Pedobacter sp. ASV19]